MKKTLLFVLLCASIFFAGCNSEPETDSNGTSGGNQGEQQKPEPPTAMTLEKRLASAQDREVIDIKAEKLTEITRKAFTINKPVTIKNGDASESTFKITVSGVTFEDVTGVDSFTVAESVEDGEFTVINGGDVQYLNVYGGGGDSIHITSTKITSATANKEGVRILLKDGGDTKATIEKITVNAPCVLEAESEESAFSKVSVAGGVENVTLRGKTKIEQLVVASSESKILVGSSDIKIEKGANIGGSDITFAIDQNAENAKDINLSNIIPESITKNWKLWLDEAYLQDDGTAAIDDIDDKSITVTASKTPSRYPWDANLNFWFPLKKETQYLVEFEAKFDGDPAETSFNVYDGTQQKNVAVAPFKPTSEWKTYRFMLPIYKVGADGNLIDYFLNHDIEFSFRLTEGTLSVKDFEVYDCWKEDFQYASELNKWDVWFSAGSGISVMMYDVSENAAKAIRVLDDEDAEASKWLSNVGYKMGALPAGDYRFSFHYNGGSLHEINAHIASHGNDKELGQATGIDGEGLYYVDFTVPENYDDASITMQFWFDREKNNMEEWQFTKRDTLDVSDITCGPAAEVEIPSNSKQLTYTPQEN